MTYTYETNPVNSNIIVKYKDISLYVDMKRMMVIKGNIPQFNIAEYINDNMKDMIKENRIKKLKKVLE